jgi:NCS2 family nucleobase:cation symporter-2
MRIGINWIFGNLFGPTAPSVVNPDHVKWLADVGTAASAPGSVVPAVPKGFISNISVLLGIVIGAAISIGAGIMNFSHVGKAEWFALIAPFHFGMPIFDPILILNMTLVMIVVMIESTGMFLALSDMTGKKVDQPALSSGIVPLIAIKYSVLSNRYYLFSMYCR